MKKPWLAVGLVLLAVSAFAKAQSTPAELAPAKQKALAAQTALPSGHPDTGGAQSAQGSMPAGHPSVGSSTAAAPKPSDAWHGSQGPSGAEPAESPVAAYDFTKDRAGSAAEPLKNANVTLVGGKVHPGVVYVEQGASVNIVNQDTRTHQVVGYAVVSGQEPEVVFQLEMRSGEGMTYVAKDTRSVHILCEIDGHVQAGLVGKITVVARP